MDEYNGPKTNVVDNAYDETLKKYGQDQALGAIFQALQNYQYQYITSSNNARQGISNLIHSEILHILAEYAISSFTLRKRELLSIDSIKQYNMDINGELPYDQETSIDIFATVVTENPFVANQLIMLNKRLKEDIVRSFVEERYAQNKRAELDSATPFIRLPDHYMSKSILTNMCREMRKQEIDEIDGYSSEGFGQK